MLVEGEALRLRGRAEEARGAFQQAAAAAEGAGHLGHRALAKELEALLLRRAGHPDARALAEEARTAYERWGAMGKANRVGG